MRKIALIFAIALFSAVALPSAAATCAATHSTYFPLTQLDDYANPFYVNDTYGVDFGDGIQYIACNATSNALCYTNSTDYGCYLDDTQMPMVVLEGNGTSYGDLDDDLVGYWDMDAINPIDNSNYGHDGTKDGTTDPVITDGKIGHGLDLPGAGGTGAIVDVGIIGELNGSAEFTLTFWVNPQNMHTEHYVSAWKTGDYFFIRGDGTNSFWYGFSDSVGSTEGSGTSNSVVTGTWYFIAVTYDGSTAKVYLDNVEDYSSSALSAVLATPVAPLRLGGYTDTNHIGDTWLDEVMVWNRSLSANEIEALYNNTHPDGYSTVGASTSMGNITLTSPTNTTYTGMSFWLNWTNQTDYDAAWYSLNGAANVTMTGNVEFTPAVGSNDITVWLNTSTGAEYNDSVYFTWAPTVDIDFTSPANGSYQAPPSVAFEWNYTSGIACSDSLYSVDGGTNTSSSCGNFTLNISDYSTGLHNVTLFVDNTAGYADAETIWISVQRAVVDCSAAGAITAINFTFATEDDLTGINGSADYAITDIDSGYTWNYSVDNVTNITVCILDSPRTVSMTMMYWSEHDEDHDHRTYYLYEASLDSTLDEIELLCIPSASSEKLEVSVRDANDKDVEDAYVNIQRYYIDEDTYRTVSIGKTSSEGTFLSYIYPDDVFYKFIISLAGSTVNTEGPLIITDTADDPEELVLYTTTTETESFDIRDSVGVNCYINYTTNYTVCTVNDASGLVSSATMTVAHSQIGDAVTVCSETGSGSAFTLNCDLGADANGTYSYLLRVLTSEGNTYTLSTGYGYFPETTVFGDYGLFPTFMLILVIGVMGVMSPGIAAVLAVVGVAAAVMLDMFELGAGALVSLVVVAAMIVIRRPSQ